MFSHYFHSKIFINDFRKYVCVQYRKSNQAVTLRNVLGKYSCSIYALESMLYLTTGIMDKYENTNIDLETAIFTVKPEFSSFFVIELCNMRFDCNFQTYSQDQLLNLTIELLNFVDTRVTLRDHPLNHLIRNAIQFKFCEPQNELKLHIGREGIRYRLVNFPHISIFPMNNVNIIYSFRFRFV